MIDYWAWAMACSFYQSLERLGLSKHSEHLERHMQDAYRDDKSIGKVVVSIGQ